MKMNKALRVPRGSNDDGEYRIERRGGSLIVIRNNTSLYAVMPRAKPALLAALLKGAGAVRVRIQRPRGSDFYYISALPGESVPKSVVETGHLDDGYVWLLPIPEDTP